MRYVKLINLIKDNLVIAILSKLPTKQNYSVFKNLLNISV